MNNYSFVTIWKLNAPLEEAWKEIKEPSQWPAWWKGVEAVTDIRQGNEQGIGSEKRFTWKGLLPYQLSFNSHVVAVEPFKRIEGTAHGELDGKGIWTFYREENLTVIRYDWQVKTTKWWMNILAPVARPAFEWNHDVIMKWGGEGLAKRLRCQLIPG